MSVKDQAVVPATMDDLCAFLHAELGTKGLHEMAAMDVSRIQNAMANYVAKMDDWQRFRHFDEGRYTRNLVDSGNGKFNLMILCWPEGVKSPIHDHSGSHCLMKIIEGELTESLFSWPDKAGADMSASEEPSTGSSMTLTRDTVYQSGEVAYMHDNIGLHRVANASSKPAVSLHLYCPPYEFCKTFDEKTSVARGSGRCVFYSEGGVIKRQGASSEKSMMQ